MIIFTSAAKFRHVSDADCLSTLGISLYLFYRKRLLNSNQKKNAIGHHNRLRESDDLPLWRAPAIKKKPPFFNERSLITRESVKLCAVKLSKGPFT